MDPYLAWTITIGDLENGFQHIGLFKSAGEANEWADDNLHRSDWWVATPIHNEQPYTR